MKPRIIIPLRSLREGKSRLGPSLGPDERALLIARMFDHVLSVAQRCGPTWVVSRDPSVLERVGQPISDAGEDLNAALEQAAATLGGSDPVLTLNADLPLLASDDLVAMFDLLRVADVVAAPDRAGHGTNALLLARPGLLPYQFGLNSLAAHRSAAEAAGLGFATCTRPGLATDIDLPEDLASLPSRFPR